MNNTMPDWGQNDLVASDHKEVVNKNTEQIFPISFSDSASLIEFKQNMKNLISFFTKHSLPELGGFDLDDVYSQKGKIPFPNDEVVGGKETTPITYLCDKYNINPLNVTSIKVTDHETDQNLKVITIEKLVF